MSGGCLARRFNTSGNWLEDSEIRKGVYRSAFLDLVIHWAAPDLFKNLTPHMAKGVDARSERQELVTCFFIYCDRYMAFRHDVRKFLDSNMDELNTSAHEDRLAGMGAEFDRTMQFIRKFYQKAFYRPDGGKRVPRVRFEAIAVGTALTLRSDPALKAPSDA